MKSGFKVIGANGQVSIGKEWAGKLVVIERPSPSTWLIRTVTVTPNDQVRVEAKENVSDFNPLAHLEQAMRRADAVRVESVGTAGATAVQSVNGAAQIRASNTSVTKAE